MSKVGVLSFVAKTTFPFNVQAEMYRRNITHPFEFWVMNDADEESTARAIQKECDKHSLNCTRIPQSIHADRNPSALYGHALNWAVHEFAQDHGFDMILMNHSDIFPFAPISLLEYMGDHQLASTMEDKINGSVRITYCYPAIVIINMRTLVSPRELTFDCGLVTVGNSKVATDTGGTSYYYL